MDDSGQERRAPRLLVVDDQPEVLETLAEFLTMHGYEVSTAQSADDAFVLIGVAAPDVVLLDIEMPLVDGVTVLRRLRESHPHVPVVMVTGNSDVDLARDTLELGAFDYVVKPFDFTHLAHVVEVAVAHRG